MKTKLTLLALASASLLTATASLRAADPVPPTPPVNPPPAAPEAAKPERGHGGPGGRPGGDRLAMMKEQLGLTPEQVEKIKPILEKDREKIQALRADTTSTREQKGEKMREIITASMEEIKPILTAEQLEKFKAGMEKRREEMQKRRAAQEKK